MLMLITANGDGDDDYGCGGDNDNDKDYVIWPAYKAKERILKILEKIRVIWPRDILS